MMTLDAQLKLQAYLDCELNEAETKATADWLSKDAAARALLQELQTTKDLLSGAEPELRVPESREFYWSKISREIERQRSPIDREVRRRPYSWLGWLVPVGAATAVVVLLLGSGYWGTPPARVAQEIDASAEDISVITFRSESEGLTVVWIASD